MFLKRFLAARPRTLPRGEQRDRQGEGLEDMSGVFHNQYKRLIHFSRNLSATLYSFVRPLFS